MATREVWDHQPEEGETDAPYAAFRKYLYQPRPRNIAALARELGYRDDTLHHWSAEFCWTERSEAYDLHLDHVDQVVTEDERRELARERAAVARQCLQVAALALRRYADDLAKEVASRPVSAQAAARLVQVGAQLQRLELDLPTDKLESSIDLSKVSDEVLAALDAVTKR